MSGLFFKQFDCAMLDGINSASCHPFVGSECSAVPLGGVEWENGLVSKYCHVYSPGIHLGTHGVSFKRVLFKCICSYKNGHINTHIGSYKSLYY